MPMCWKIVDVLNTVNSTPRLGVSCMPDPFPTLLLAWRCGGYSLLHVRGGGRGGEGNLNPLTLCTRTSLHHDWPGASPACGSCVAMVAFAQS